MKMILFAAIWDDEVLINLIVVFTNVDVSILQYQVERPYSLYIPETRLTSKFHSKPNP
jgi:hypothetical protein